MPVGDVLMSPRFDAFCVADHGLADVAVPQAYNLDVLSCHSRMNSVKLAAGRTQAAYTSQWGRADGVSSVTTLQENRSRGCRRAKWFSRWSWLHSLQAVLRRKKKSYTSMRLRFRPSRPIPANTSNRPGRAISAVMAGPALILSGVSFDAGRWLRHHAPLGSICLGRAGGMTC